MNRSLREAGNLSGRVAGGFSPLSLGRLHGLGPQEFDAQDFHPQGEVALLGDLQGDASSFGVWVSLSESLFHLNGKRGRQGSLNSLFTEDEVDTEALFEGDNEEEVLISHEKLHHPPRSGAVVFPNLQGLGKAAVGLFTEALPEGSASSKSEEECLRVGWRGGIGKIGRHGEKYTTRILMGGERRGDSLRKPGSALSALNSWASSFQGRGSLCKAGA